MNRKVLRAILFTLAAAVWGAVMVKAFVRRPATEHTEARSEAGAQAMGLRPEAPALDLKWARDPFLDHHPGGGRTPLTRTGQATVPPQRPRPPASAAAPVQVDWPAMDYVGRISGAGGESRPVALFQVNGRDMAIRTGDHWRGIQVMAVHADSVVLRQGTHTRSLLRGHKRSERGVEKADGENRMR
ncbi:MAG TPA: hypothetical protein PKE21_13590 [Flavobacteriales bacterium]|nr:hypothetical protein [Flavobacteriales bacterium]HMR28509.1 hypothetical protein [Flavobacteriales bacterium]